MLDVPEMRLVPNGRLAGHAGLGGSLAFADPDSGVGFGYTMNKMILPEEFIDPRWPGLVNAIYEAL
jgi:hypothetical protein